VGVGVWVCGCVGVWKLSLLLFVVVVNVTVFLSSPLLPTIHTAQIYHVHVYFEMKTRQNKRKANEICYSFNTASPTKRQQVNETKSNEAYTDPKYNPYSSFLLQFAI
jgi:hypothetical protein